MKRVKLPAMNNALKPLVEKRKKRFDKHFRHTEYRRSQLEAIVLIGEMINEGFENIILSGPTGSGKSDIAMTVCKAYQKAKNWRFALLSSQLNLMEQYRKDFPELKTLKGRKNFGCDIQPCTAADAPCAKIKNYKCAVDEFVEGKRVRTCQYFVQKKEAEQAIGYISTPWYVFLETIQSYSKFRDRELAILDEAHNIEHILVEQLTTRWTQKNHQYLFGKTMPFPTYAEAWQETPTGELAWMIYFNECQKVLNAKRKEIKLQRKAGRKDKTNEDEMLLIGELQGKIAQFKHLLDSPHSILAEVQSGRYGMTANFKPLAVKDFAPEILQRVGARRIFMSATVDANMLCKTLGLDKEKTAVIDITDSNFPIESRKVFQSNITKLDYNTGFRNAVPKLGDFIRKRLVNHIGENCMVFAPSFELCNKLATYLQPYHNKILTHDSKTRDRTFKKFIDGPERGYLLITPSMTEGYDLKGDICRMLIVVKIPYPSLGDTLVRRRMLMHEREWRDMHEGGPLCPYEPSTNGGLCSNYACSKPCQAHYRAQTAFKLVQVIGRGVRSDDDFCEMWILDSGWSNFYRTSDTYMPEWFRDSLTKIE